MFETLEELEKVLHEMYIKNISSYFGCSAGHYDYLPTLSCFSEKDIDDLIFAIMNHTEKETPENISQQEAIDMIRAMIRNASFIGMALAHMLARDGKANLSFFSDKFFSSFMLSHELSNHVLGFIGVDIHSSDSTDLKKLFWGCSGNAHQYISRAQELTTDKVRQRSEVAVGLSVKAGYNLYFRKRGYLQGNDADEDQKKLDLLLIEGFGDKSAMVDISGNKESLSDDERKNTLVRRYGALMLKTLDVNTREAAYTEMEKLEVDFPEAGVALGQYYFNIDRQKARYHFKFAADVNIHEGEWGYAGTIIHSSVPRKDIANDVEWEKYCLRAAEGGCSDAANEMGNICNRRGCIVEAAYWYGMAYFLEHPQGLLGVKGILQKWLEAGKPEDYKAGTDHYTNERHQAAVLFLKGMSDKPEFEKMERLYLRGEVLAGLFYGYFFQKGNANEYAYDAYNMLLLEDCPHPHVMRCCADMLASGTGTEKNVDEAFRLYTKAAKEGNAPSMYALGQKAKEEGNNDLAAGWFGMAYVRGYDLAGENLAALVK